MEIEKILNLSDAELALQERQTAEQLFRLRFQMRMGQSEGLEKLRGLKKDVARIQTVVRQRELGIVTTHAASGKPAQAHKPVKAKAVKAEAKAAPAKTAAKPKKAAAKSKAAKGNAKAAKSKAKKETR